MKALIFFRRAGATFVSLAIALLLNGCGGEQKEEVSWDIRGAPIRQATNLLAPSIPTGASSTVALAEQKTAAIRGSNSTATVRDSSEKYKPVGFDRLSGYAIEVSDEVMSATNSSTASVDTQIPVTVRALDKKPISLQGFMLPLKVQAGQVTEMLIMKDQSMCCYGTVPRINEWVSVKMSGEGVKPIMDQPVTIFGTLHVGEMRENGYLVGIYSLDGEKMAGPTE